MWNVASGVAWHNIVGVEDVLEAQCFGIIILGRYQVLEDRRLVNGSATSTFYVDLVE